MQAHLVDFASSCFLLMIPFRSLEFPPFALGAVFSSEVKVTQWSLTLCDPMDYTVHGILQARILEWVAVPFSRGYFLYGNCYFLVVCIFVNLWLKTHFQKLPIYTLFCPILHYTLLSGFFPKPINIITFLPINGEESAETLRQMWKSVIIIGNGLGYFLPGLGVPHKTTQK